MDYQRERTLMNFITEEWDENEPDAVKYVEAVVKALDLGDNEILLGIAWCTEESRINHTCFPHILGVDVIHGTNNERHPYLCVIGRQ